MSTGREIHHKAMELVHQSFAARNNGDIEKYVELTKQALVFEKEAALMLLDKFEAEPTRSIMFRGAGTLAFNCGEVEQAEELVNHGLKGNPPAEVENELKDLQRWILLAKKHNFAHARHNQAMEAAEHVYFEKSKKGDPDEVQALIKESFLLELQAAYELLHKKEEEPSRSVLFRSAATLAYDCKEFRQAEKLILIGLDGNPPSEIRQELIFLKVRVINKLVKKKK